MQWQPMRERQKKLEVNLYFNVSIEEFRRGSEIWKLH